MTEPASLVAPGATTEVDVTIILPVFNEVDHLKQEVDRIRTAMDASEYSYEIIVVDDGSSDGSGEAAEALGGLRVIRFLQNRGSGSARKAGTTAARGRVTVRTPRLKTTKGAAFSATACSGVSASITTISAGLPTAMP